MINHIRDYFATCPLLSTNRALNVDFLSKDITEYSIETEPHTLIVETYIDGSSIRKCNFIFAVLQSRQYAKFRKYPIL